VLLLGAISLVTAACGGDSETTADGEDGAACEPSGTTVEVTAKGIDFDTDCLAAPADQPFEIVFHNDDGGIPHNVAIYPGDGDPVFQGEVFTGAETMTYDVPALDPGTYKFQCDVHPQMNGEFVVA
jgi:plastocyanin